MPDWKTSISHAAISVSQPCCQQGFVPPTHGTDKECWIEREKASGADEYEEIAEDAIQIDNILDVIFDNSQGDEEQ